MNTFLAAQALVTLDWIVIAGYFILLLGLAWWVISKSKDTADDYFLAGRHLGWFIVGASIFASNIGSEHLVGLAGSGASDGVAMAHYELHAWCLLVLGWVFVPFYMRSRVFTMPEFLERRFSPTSRWVLSLISLVAYVVTKIAVGIFAGGIVFSVLLPEINIDLGFMVLDGFWLGSILVIVLTGAYTVLGGLRAVAYTEALQTFILVIGSFFVTVFGLIKLGGWAELREICGSEMFNLWKPLVPEGVTGTWAPVEETNAAGEIVRQAWYFNGNYPWLSMLFCAPIIGLWYWCTDQYIVQRALGAPNEQQARRGSIFAGLLKLLPVFIFIIPGMIAYALHTSGKLESLALDSVAAEAEVVVVTTDPTTGAEGPPRLVDQATLQAWAAEDPADPRLLLARTTLVVPHPEQPGTDAALFVDEATLERWRATGDERISAVVRQSNLAFPLLVREVLPPGIRGIVVAGLLAALMSSLAGVFNASATLFTMDFYSKLRPGTSQQRLVWIGRIATTVMVAIGLAWIPVIRGGKNLYDYLQGVQAYLAPPIFVVFFLGVFIKRLNSKGCLWALSVGFALGLFRLAVDTPVALKLSGYEDGYDYGSFLWIVNKMFFQYYSLVIFLVCVVVMLVASYMSRAPDYERISGLTYGTISEAHRAESRSSFDWRDIFWSCMVLVAILVAYLYFNG